MLAFLDALCAALMAQDADAVRRLLDHPLAGALPDAVRGEAQQVIDRTGRPHVMPLATLRLVHQTAHCLGVARETRPLPQSRTAPATQMELPFVSPRINVLRKTAIAV